MTHGGSVGGELAQRRVVTKQRVAYQRFEQVASCSRSELLYTKQRVAYRGLRLPAVSLKQAITFTSVLYSKDNGENIMKSSMNGTFSYGYRSQMLLLEELRVQFNKVQKTIRETNARGNGVAGNEEGNSTRRMSRQKDLQDSDYFKDKVVLHASPGEGCSTGEETVIVSYRGENRSCEPYNAKDVTALIEQNDCVRVELEKVKQHYKELYDSIKITRTHTSEKTSTMLNEIESLKAQLRSKESCFTSDYVRPKVLAAWLYAMTLKPIPHSP
ncbi:hypothetical protein Tco_0412826 [Tanacetum coccineum]